MIRKPAGTQTATGVTPLLLPICIAILGFVINAVVATSMADTIDEWAHVSYGAAILRGNADRWTKDFDSKMPFSALNAFPKGVGIVLHGRGLAPQLSNWLRDFRATRYPTLIAASFLCLLIYYYSASLFGHPAGILTQLLFVISPNIIAHSTLATTDLYIALATIAFLFALRRFLKSPTGRHAAWVAVTLSVAQLTKFTALYLYPVMALSLLAAYLYSRYGNREHTRLTLHHTATLLALSAVSFIAAINIGFLFDRTFTPLAGYRFRSAQFQQLQQIPAVRDIPLPLPYPYLQGFDWMSYHNDNAASFGNIVLFGEVRGKDAPRSDGFPSYYLMAYLFKEPLGAQLLLLLGLLWTARHRRLPEFLAAEFPLLLTILAFVVTSSLVSKTQIGIRHVLPALAAAVILSGGAFSIARDAPRKRWTLPIACLCWIALSVAGYFPHMIPYFNELLTDRRFAYRILADSNLDWGQNMWIVEKYIKDHPHVQLDPTEPTTGMILVRANKLAGVNSTSYWLHRKAPEPLAHVGYGHLLVSIPAK